jgi:hypothetical protein
MNVHCALSVGIIAAVDVGCSGRWELLLLGQPLIDVALADSRAKLGEIILSNRAFESLCHDKKLYSSFINEKVGSFECEILSNGCFRVRSFVPHFNELFDRDDNDYDVSMGMGIGSKLTLISSLLHEV